MQLVPAVFRRHPRAVAVSAVLGLGALVFGLVWFEPQKLFVEDRVSEALPGAPAAGMGGAQGEPAPGEQSTPRRQVLAEGDFIGLEHETVGRALVVETDDGRRFLRFEGFETSNGPDLVVYLSAKTPAGPDDWYGYDRDFVDLGALKGNVGSQNYLVPMGVDLDRYSTAVVWCRRFTVGFAAAELR
jgi:Electron transfer DM13